MERKISLRRFGPVDKPHIYKTQVGPLGYSVWHYNTGDLLDRRNIPAHAFCRKLTEESLT